MLAEEVRRRRFAGEKNLAWSLDAKLFEFLAALALEFILRGKIVCARGRPSIRGGLRKIPRGLETEMALESAPA